MRRPAVLLCLLAALTGTPLRQAEAAADLTRSLVAFLQATHCEPTDGGVGDDAGEGTLRIAQGSLAEAAPSTADPCIAVPPLAPSPTRFEIECLRERVWWPPSPPGRRHAWLQVFRF